MPKVMNLPPSIDDIGLPIEIIDIKESSKPYNLIEIEKK
jgi:hypothetical protein